ncbi:MAG TPA: hypothetical protein VNZ25_02840 [Candidatus Angelobacter sp.]|nr:hypothetical protein [Candidatus Angelobacter sp.]
MINRPTWWSGNGALLVCLILAGIIVSNCMRTPNTVGGGAGMMFVMIVLAVIFKASFQFVMMKRRKRRQEKFKQEL